MIYDYVTETKLREKLMALSGNNYEIVSSIKSLGLAIAWVKQGYSLIEFYLLELNNCDLELAFEMKRILDIIKH